MLTDIASVEYEGKKSTRNQRNDGFSTRSRKKQFVFEALFDFDSRNPRDCPGDHLDFAEISNPTERGGGISGMEAQVKHCSIMKLAARVFGHLFYL